jgi:mannose PTS system EIIA component
MDDKVVGLILVSHGDFARESLQSAEMIMGDQKRVRTVSVVPGMDLEQVKKGIEDAIKEVEGPYGVIIMTDMIGGTPSNAAGFFSVVRDDVVVMTGFNMPMILEFFTCRCAKLEDVADKVCTVAQQGIINLTSSIRKQNSNSKNGGVICDN